MIIFEQKKAGKIVTILLIALAIVQFLYYDPILPEQIASHFNLKGQPDNWSGKRVVLFTHLGLILFFALVFQFAGWLTCKIPEALINLPRKSYWLALERKQLTLDSIATFLIWIGNVSIVFFVVIFNLVYQANLSSNPRTANFWFALIIFLLAIGYMVFFFFKRFYNIPLHDRGKYRLNQ